MNYYKNVGYYEGFNGKWYCSISYQEFNTKSEVKKFIKSNNTNQGEIFSEKEYKEII